MEIRGESFVLAVPDAWEVFVLGDNVKGSSGLGDVFQISGSSAHRFSRLHKLDFASAMTELERMTIETIRETDSDTHLKRASETQEDLGNGTLIRQVKASTLDGATYFTQSCVIGPACVLLLTHEGPMDSRVSEAELFAAVRRIDWRQKAPRNSQRGPGVGT
jgi:hypothetical protein